MFHEDRQTDEHKYRQAGVIKLIVNFCNFAQVLKCSMLQVGLVVLLPYGTPFNITN
jgi:hypothetical protein